MKRTLEGKPLAAQAAAAFSDPCFSANVVAWQKRHGRHALPWQNTRDAYRVWLSEIMLQQTQVATVIPYYQRFLERFPTVEALAAAPQEEVMALWSGLGYYSRARNLHRCAQQVVSQYGGRFPSDPALLAELPGIGRSTAAAIAAFSYGTRAAILDGNVKRVFARVFGIEGVVTSKPVEDQMWLRALALLPEEGIEAYTQGLMDLGATICTRSRPACERCPLAARCVARATGRTGELPARAVKKAVPEKHAVMLVVIHGGELLLEQRPGSGIWGGLLSLPQAGGMEPQALAPELLQQEVQAAASVFGEPAAPQRLQPFTHQFTHFKLHVQPFQVELIQRAPMAAEGGHVWLPLAGIQSAPLPAPVKRLLLGLFGQAGLFS